LPTKGTKAKLIQRLNGQDPNIWTILGEKLGRHINFSYQARNDEIHQWTEDDTSEHLAKDCSDNP